MKQYYVILNEDMKHFGMEYHLGLNEDIRPFEPDTECGGGLFFSDKEHVLNYLCYNHGTKLAIIEIPEGEQVVNFGDVYKAHRIIIKEIQELWIPENYEWLKSIFVGNNIIFQKACKCGALNFAKWLYVNFKNLDIHENKELAFRYACSNGHLETAKWLDTIEFINVHVYDDFAFRSACANGHLEIAKWLHNTKIIDIHANKEFAFRLACENGHLEIAKWLYSLGNIEIQLYRNELFGYVPKHVLNWLKTL